MNRTRVKICGIRDAAHAKVATDAGADAIGLVFHKPSPRFLTAAEAGKIARTLPPFVSAVGLFVNLPAGEVRAILEEAPLDLLQFHGDETPEYCAQFGIPFIRVAKVGRGVDLLEYAGRFSRAKALILDADVPGEAGGTGRAFEWSAVPRNLPIPLILSGGLTSGNVGRAVREVKPWAVDVSSGVESARGVKDPAKIVEFIRSVRSEDAKSG
ncbi:MAG TPA: phosphoribosylanthranilate isomerase [Usitatibacter sp.]|jgi:phosphoribosylanthranilate isomerase|nr:phosphoribosylanthranilate isomerase [Usitatibacter sp.]